MAATRLRHLGNTKNTMTFRNLLVAWALVLASFSCTRPETPSAALVLTPEVQKEARQVYAARCLSCHGPNGEGNGPAASALRPRPRNFADKMWQSNVTDRHIETIIAFGGAAVGKSSAMPGNPDLVSKPLLVAGLRALVRDLGK